MTSASVDIPKGWIELEPPEGVTFIAVDDDSDADIAPNVVVTVLQAPEPCSQDAVDRYLTAAIDELATSFDQADVLEVWTAGLNECGVPLPGEAPTQRILMHHVVADTTIEMMQQHRWIDDRIVVSTFTLPIGIDEAMVDLLLDCLDNVALTA